MNHPPLTIFSDNGVLMGAIMPDLPKVDWPQSGVILELSEGAHYKAWFETAKREAIEKALPIENFEIAREKCTCPCHKNLGMMHFMACCDNGFIWRDGVWPGLYEVREKRCKDCSITDCDCPFIEKVYHLSI